MVAKAKIAASSGGEEGLVEQNIEDADVEHDGPQMLEVDHLAHHHDADAHPEDAARQHQIAHALGEEQR